MGKTTLKYISLPVEGGEEELYVNEFATKEDVEVINSALLKQVSNVLSSVNKTINNLKANVEENLTELETSMYNMLESELDYFYVERVDYNSNVVLRILNTDYFYQEREKLEYSYDKITWNKVKDGDYNFSYRIYFRCVGDSITANTGYTTLFSFPSLTTTFNIGGNVDMLMYNYKNVASGNYTLTNTCYYELFKGLRIYHAKDLRLPSMNLKDACYLNMFSHCSTLITAPELPATTLAKMCYAGMFEYCTSLQEAPILHAKTIVYHCYHNMFMDCLALNYIKCLCEPFNVADFGDFWVRSVSSLGTFVKNVNTNWPRNENGIPSGWTVVDYLIPEEQTMKIAELQNTISTLEQRIAALETQ